MQIELSSSENALMIYALTVTMSRLKEQKQMFIEDKMPHWADDAQREIDAVLALKERLFK